MSLLDNYAALAELTVLPNVAAGGVPEPLRWGTYTAFPVNGQGSWRALFGIHPAGLPPGATAAVKLRLQPGSEAVARLAPGLEFELRDDGRPVAYGRITHCWFGCVEGAGVRTLTYQEFLAEVLPAVQRIFVVRDTPFSGNVEGAVYRPFQPAVLERGILDCIWPYFAAEQCRAFVSAAHAIGDSGVFLWVQETGISEQGLEDFPAFYFPLGTAAAENNFLQFYEVNYPVLGTAIFSATGRWGAVSYGGATHAVVGGPPAFMAALYAALDTTIEAQVRDFFTGWEGSQWLLAAKAGNPTPPCPWIPDLLVHLYGSEQAGKLIATVLATA